MSASRVGRTAACVERVGAAAQRAAVAEGLEVREGSAAREVRLEVWGDRAGTVGWLEAGAAEMAAVWEAQEEMAGRCRRARSCTAEVGRPEHIAVLL